MLVKIFTRILHPNHLTIFRILLAPVILLALFLGELTLALTCFVLASLSDLLDGILAREFQLTTKLGALLDPLADKILALPLLVFFASQGLLSIWIVLLLCLRDVSITAIRIRDYEKESSNSIINPCLMAKLKSALLDLAIFLLLIEYIFHLGGIFDYVQYLVYLSCLLSYASAYSYFRKMLAS